MSSDGSSIVCRRCGETIPLEAGSCPHCGKDIRNITGPAVAIVLGLILVGSAILGGSQLYVFGAVGLVMAASGGYILYDRRQRIQEAAQRGATATTSEGEGEEEEEESIF
ncbi:MAG: hypothetical protein ABEJ68_02425 [Halobacteriaceae archaeon]